MNNELIFVELKSGHNDDGPAWIGFAKYSKSHATVYFNGKAFKTLGGQGVGGNYCEAESGDTYWISGVKKNRQDRHWAGHGKIKIDKKAVESYLKHLGLSELPRNLEPTELKPSEQSEQHHESENKILTDEENREARKKWLPDLSD